MAEFRKTKIAEIRAQVGDARVICGLSGGSIRPWPPC
jgi:GMP synthase (glutamine-hydrolysing)